MAINEKVTGNDSVAITGTASAGERTVGVVGQGDSVGVKGVGKGWNGVEGISQSTIGGAGVFGANDTGAGVRGESNAKFNAAVHGVHKGQEGSGVQGEAEKGTGVVGISKTGVGVFGESQGFEGVHGVSHAAGHGAVVGFNDQTGGTGVFGTGPGRGVWGQSTGNDFGVVGNSVGGIGVIGTSQNDVGVHGKGGRLAGFFEGDVEVTGKLVTPKSTITCFDVIISNADCAEDFNIGADLSVAPGTVMMLGEEAALFPSLHAYDKRVAGVISGAGEYKPGIVLDKQKSDRNRQPVALLGKVFCKVDAQYGAIEVGDLLTTSPTPGHAMKATDHEKAFGAVIGKALRPLSEGQELIPILIALQ